ncbi:MAG: hypothetical protein R3296_08835 [Oleiphilaceae bacterium]|nr:hypothetical protein [Oleiphilaceae bacterium]
MKASVTLARVIGPPVIALSLLSTAMAEPSVYRCEGEHGPVFITIPCGDDSQPLDLSNPPPGGRIARPPEPTAVPSDEDNQPDNAPEEAASSPCKDFTSTELRTLRIGERIERGMSREQVEASWGSPVDRVPGPPEVWTYDNRYYGRVVSLRKVYFRDGCVEGIRTGVDP